VPSDKIFRWLVYFARWLVKISRYLAILQKVLYYKLTIYEKTEQTVWFGQGNYIYLKSGSVCSIIIDTILTACAEKRFDF
jgi:hypothetical protein